MLYTYISVINYSLIVRMDSGGFRHVQHFRPNMGPTKRAPHKRSGKFLHAGNNGRPLSEMRVMNKKNGRQFLRRTDS